ncbi:MAG: MarP family serine protease [Actinomycetota bacterium]
MTPLDWGIVAFAVALAIWGYRQGLIVGALTLAGFAAGALLGSRLAPALLSQGSESPYAPLFAAFSALVLGAVVAVTLEGFAIGVRRRLIRGPATDLLDGAGGAILIAAVALGLAWMFGAVALHTPGATELRRDVQRSEILQRLNDVLPPSGPILNALNRVDPRQAITGPAAPVGATDEEIVRDPEVRAAGAGVVKVLGTACGLAVEGSGWMAAPGLVVTNAHVVAGERDTTVETQQGTQADATPVHYEPANDLALLRVSLDLPVLPLAAEPKRGADAAVLGYPENGPFTISPARFGDTQQVISQDSYGRAPIRREMSSLRGHVRSGNSGGPAVDARGRVLTTVFAATTSGTPGGYGVPNEIVRAALGQSSAPVGTGPCAVG